MQSQEPTRFGLDRQVSIDAHRKTSDGLLDRLPDFSVEPAARFFGHSWMYRPSLTGMSWATARRSDVYPVRGSSLPVRQLSKSPSQIRERKNPLGDLYLNQAKSQAPPAIVLMSQDHPVASREAWPQEHWVARLAGGATMT